MEPLESILQSLVCIRSLLILKFYFVVFILYAFIDKLTNEQRDKPVESIFLVTYIIVPQDFFKFIDNFVIWREIAKVLFSKRFYPNLIGNGILGEDQIIMDLPSIGLFPGFILADAVFASR